MFAPNVVLEIWKASKISLGITTGLITKLKWTTNDISCDRWFLIWKSWIIMKELNNYLIDVMFGGYWPELNPIDSFKLLAGGILTCRWYMYMNNQSNLKVLYNLLEVSEEQYKEVIE